MEASTAIQQSLETAVMMHLYPNSEIEVKVQVLQTDGGALTAAINACTLALIDAGIAMRDFVVGCSVTYIQRTPLLGACMLQAVGWLWLACSRQCHRSIGLSKPCVFHSKEILLIIMPFQSIGDICVLITTTTC